MVAEIFDAETQKYRKRNFYSDQVKEFSAQIQGTWSERTARGNVIRSFFRKLKSCLQSIARINRMIKSIFHINVNVKNFERSLEFYKMLGFKVILDLGEGPNKGNDKGLNIPNSSARAALLALGDDPHATRIDLIEWQQPQTEGTPYPHLYHAGVARIALFTKNLDEEYARLRANGVEMVSEPVTIRFANKAGAKFFCFKDPDGTFLELIEPFNG